MRHAALAMAVAVAMVAMVGCGSRRQPAPAQATMESVTCPIQAVPVRNWLQAALAGDEGLLKTVFAQRVRPILEAAGWERVLRTYRDLWVAALGPSYDVERLRFTYTGDQNWGHVLVDSSSGTLPPIRVVNDGGVWRVFEDGLGPWTVADPGSPSSAGLLSGLLQRLPAWGGPWGRPAAGGPRAGTRPGARG